MNSQKFSIDHEPLEVELLIRSDQRHVTVDDHHAERQRIASEAAATEAKQRQLEAILHPVRIAETDPLDVPDVEELLEAIRAEKFEGEGARP